jgi:glycosyltransferase involved in cell wall biosynthesis
MAERRLIICSKSTWLPAVRREHALAQLAAADGVPVTFLQRPLDVRALRGRSGARAWWRGVRARPEAVGAPPGVTVRATACLVPGHRDDLAERQLAVALGALLRRTARSGDVVVATTPWQWRALRGLPAGVRRVFDSADDWASLIPDRADAFRATCARIGQEADAVLVVNEDMVAPFGAGDVRVLRNGVHRSLIEQERAGLRRPRSMVYVGTLSERFDAPLVAGLLRELGDWTLDLYGPCQYPGRGDAPGDELTALLDEHRGRVAWHGVLGREELAGALDAAAVGLLPNRPERSRGQDAMKLYDYAARGLPVASTAWSADLARLGPPVLAVADGAAALASAVTALAALGDEAQERQRAWAAQNTWDARWPAWRAALLQR